MWTALQQLPFYLYAVLVDKRCAYMVHIRFRPQGSFTHGALMCSSAATALCVYMFSRKPEPERLCADNFNKTMGYGSELNIKIRKALFPHGRARTVTVMEVIENTALKKLVQNNANDMCLHEVAGLVQGTAEDMRGALCMDLGELLRTLTHGECCAVTCKGHTFAVGWQYESCWLADSLPGVYVSAPGWSKQPIKTMLQDLAPSAEQYSAVVFRHRAGSKR
eukprot:3552860-Rhodomonas_salina.2